MACTSGRVPVAFLRNYDMSIAKVLIAGADVWLNTPVPPLEASGTSGMKAAVNGVLNLSMLDGWWVEGCIEGVTGWCIDDASDGRLVLLELTPAGRSRIEEVFPRFNAGESALVSGLDDAEREALAELRATFRLAA